jgi:hypothetical protein
MPIAMTCTCGRALTLRDELAGKLIRCPSCAGTLNVPIAAEEIVEDVVAGPPPLPPALPPRSAQQKERDIAVAPPPPPRPKPKEPKKKKKKSVYQEYYAKENTNPMLVLDEGWFGNMNSGMVGGALTLLAGILLLVLLLVFGGFFRLMIFAGLLIIVGLLGIIKGLLDLYE